MSLLPTDRTLLWVGSIFYLAGFIVGLAGLARRQPVPARNRLLNILLIAGWVFQWLGLYLRGRTVGGCPLGNTFEIVQFVAWSAMLLYFFVGPTFHLTLLGLFTAGFAGLLALISLLLPAWDAGRSHRIFGNNPWIELHAAVAVFSYGVFGLLALTAIMQLLQNWSLRHQRLNGLFWFLPSVVQLDQINFRLLLLGELLLTVSLAVGSAWWLRDLSSVDGPKLVAALGIWLAYAVVLLLRWRGRLVSVRFAWVCLAMFALALMSLPVDSGHHAPERIILTPR